jgi:hypothetical protein
MQTQTSDRPETGRKNIPHCGSYFLSSCLVSTAIASQADSACGGLH